MLSVTVVYESCHSEMCTGSEKKALRKAACILAALQILHHPSLCASTGKPQQACTSAQESMQKVRSMFTLNMLVIYSQNYSYMELSVYKSNCRQHSGAAAVISQPVGSGSETHGRLGPFGGVCIFSPCSAPDGLVSFHRHWQIRLIGYLKLPICVIVSVNGCASLC